MALILGGQGAALASFYSGATSPAWWNVECPEGMHKGAQEPLLAVKGKNDFECVSRASHHQMACVLGARATQILLEGTCGWGLNHSTICLRF